MPQSPEQTPSPHWYTRRGTVVQGPFPAGLIRRYVILGRIRVGDELSRDLATWTPLEDLPELIPDFVQDAHDDPRMQRRLIAAKRWEDERRYEERRTDSNELQEERRREEDRRRAESNELPLRRPAANDGDSIVHGIHPGHRRGVITALVAFLVMTVVVMFLSRPAILEDGADCRRAPGPEVDWRDCSMEGRNLNGTDLRAAKMNSMALNGANLGSARLVRADLSFSNLSVASLRAADLSEARLMGTSLRGSDLSGASVENADLSYADLRNAKLDGMRMTGARFDHAVWVDGRTCLPGSVGGCFTTE